MNNDALLGAAIALCSGSTGIFLQAIIGRRSDYIKAGRQARYGAYADYFKGVALISHGADRQEIRTGRALVADARSRIALYGSSTVIQAMNKVFDNGNDVWSSKAREDLAEMLIAMRADVIWVNASVDKNDLVCLMFGEGTEVQ